MCSEKISDANLTLNEEEVISYTEVLDRLRRMDVGEYYLEKLEWRLKSMAWNCQRRNKIKKFLDM